ncbi:MAG: LamG-like jellyroll fold domain-containing protein [Pseudomonadota bacterium]|nr:LamG-like jellyroll fold domain-containing protein [Pseudomonadota bacterium]
MKLYRPLLSSLALTLALPLGCAPDEDTGADTSCEVCDGIDNDGDGLVDEDFGDIDLDGVADCIDEDTEICDGRDNDGDGTTDETFPDTDGDGTADCVDEEECDGLDNNGDGDTDEGYDDDGDGVADCLQELCNCEDDDADGEIDEGLDCSYEVVMRGSADDMMDVYVDGVAAGSSAGWSALYSQTFSLPAGTHHIATYARDRSGQIAGFNARIEVPGQAATANDTGSGSWLLSQTDPSLAYGSAWMTGAAVSAMVPDSGFLASTSCNNTWSYSPSGAPWVWAADCSREDLYPHNWYYLEVDVCPEAAAEACDGVDNDGDGAIDEGYVDSDFDGEADCIEVEDCDGFDNNGDGFIDEDYADTDGDGVADCVDGEECDGLDNNGDGFIDEGYSDTDGDGVGDCVDAEECDGLDNNGDGQTDEGYPDTDSDGVADCVDGEECDGRDNNGDGAIDEGYADTDGDGTADCVDAEECDGLDNNGDGQVDEGYSDTDDDGVADCVDEEECDGLDNNGDGQTDESYSDTDGDGVADCVDAEECDGLDNDGDGVADNGYTDTDGDGTADCVDAEVCDCSDDDGDGLIDEGLECGYEIEMRTSADDRFTAWFDGAAWGSATGWSLLSTLSTSTTAGTHTIAVHAEDIGAAIAGFNARVIVPGALDSEWDTGLGQWVMSEQNPSVYGATSTWTTAPYADMVPDSSFLATASCGSTWGTGATGPSGGAWVWANSCASPTTYSDNWFLLELEVCPEAIVDADGDGVVATLDCNDGDPSVYPGAAELCDNDIDDDCDPTTNCDDLCVDAFEFPSTCGDVPLFSGAEPLLYWDGSGIGSGRLLDSTTSGYDGTIVGSVTSGTGVAGASIELNGVNTGASVDPGDPTRWTVSQWVRPDAFPSSDLDFLTSLGNGTTSYTGWAVVVNAAGLPGVYIEGGTSSLERFVYDTEPVCLGAWTHVAVTWDALTVRLYVNGAEVSSSTPGYTTIPYGSLPFVLGFDMNRYGRYLDGALDEVGLWDSALNADEIGLLFADGACALSSW